MPKFYRIATAGETVDGREILESDLLQAFETYDPKKYTAMINIEHIRSLDPHGIFKIVGEVLELKFVKEDENKNACLFAKIDLNENIKNLSKQKQKIFFSVELMRDFAKTKKTYLTGLALTDSPASLFSDRLDFSRMNETPLKFTTEVTEEVKEVKEVKAEKDGKDEINDLPNFENLNCKQEEPTHSQVTEDTKQGKSSISLKNELEKIIKNQNLIIEKFKDLEKNLKTQQEKLSLKIVELEEELKNVDIFVATDEQINEKSKFYY